MKIIIYERISYVKVCLCSKCKTGELEFAGYSNPTSPPIYHHKCTNKDCSHTEAIHGEKYPILFYDRGKEVE